MHALIVLAHPEEHSFSAAMARAAADALTINGWTVDVDDLAREGFHAEASRDDLAVVPESDLVQLMYAQEEATATTGYAPVVADQIRRLQAADLVMCVFPFWWFAAPALMKGWFDRVFVNGVGYGHDAYEDGPLRGKRALAAVAIGGHPGMYGPNGRSGDIHALLNPIQHGTFGYAAMDVLEPFLVFEADGHDDAYRASELERLATRLAGIADEAPIRTAPLKAQ